MITHLERRLLDIRDTKIGRCWWCGDWNPPAEYCHTCAADLHARTKTLRESR